MAREQIVALEAGGEPATLALRQALERQGIYGAMFCAPATAKNRALVRLTLNAGLDETGIAKLLAACAAIRAEVGRGALAVDAAPAQAGAGVSGGGCQRQPADLPRMADSAPSCSAGASCSNSRPTACAVALACSSNSWPGAVSTA